MARLLLIGILALGLTASALAQSSPLTDTAAEAARAHLRADAPRLGLSAEDVADLVVTDGHRSGRSGIDIVYVRQRYRGVPVADALVTVALDARGTVVHTAGTLVPLRDVSIAPALSASEAVAAAARRVGAEGTPTTARAPEDGTERRTHFGEVVGWPVTARLVVVAEDRAARLAWEAQIPTADAQHVWLVRLDAATGHEIERHDLVDHDHWGPAAADDVLSRGSSAPPSARLATAADGSVYDVYPIPVESPNHALPPAPADGRVETHEPADATASPFGWHDTDGAAGAEHTVTWGNNVRAYNDRAADNTGTAADSPDCGASLNCLFPLDLTMAPSTYTDAAVTNLFYWTNLIHDVAYRHGFDEAAGNFQSNTYGKGGTGGDDLRAEAQDGSGTNGGNFSTPPDGFPPRMQMFEWTLTAPRVDAAFDAGIVLHEYAHGISNRLTGGPATVSCLQNAEQMGEGWSDFYALMLTQRPGDTGPQRRGIGTYVLGQPTTGTGIRPAPYSTNVADNGATYGDTQTAAVPHGVGFVWATILWEVTWELIDGFGFDPDVYDGAGGAGNQVALALVTEGMKLQPCAPGFVDGRDAILAADQALYGGAHLPQLWSGFARRGLGVSASQGSANTNADNVEAFDAPSFPSGVSILIDDPRGVRFLGAPAPGLNVDDLAAMNLVRGVPGYYPAASPANLETRYDVETSTWVPSAGTGEVLELGRAFRWRFYDHDRGSPAISQSVPLPMTLSTDRPPNTADVTLTLDTGGNRFNFLANPFGTDLDLTGIASWPGAEHLDPLFQAQTYDPVARTWIDAPDAIGPWQAFRVRAKGPRVADRPRVLTIPASAASLTASASVVGAPASRLGAEVDEVALTGIAPNPSAGSARVAFALPEAGTVRLSVVDVRGREVTTLVDGPRAAGRHEATLDSGSLATGVYVVRLEAGGTVVTRLAAVVR